MRELRLRQRVNHEDDVTRQARLQQRRGRVAIH